MYKIGDFVKINANPWLFNDRLILTKPGQGKTGKLVFQKGNFWCIEINNWPEAQFVHYTEADFDPASDTDTLPNLALDPKSIHTGE